MTFHEVQVEEPGRVLSTIAGQLLTTASPVERPYLIMLSGLPGSGKSYLGRLLAASQGAALVATDHVRKAFFPQPCYSADEGAAVQSLCYTLIEVLLLARVPVIFDATNSIEWQRRRVYDLTERLNVGLLVVLTTAPEAVVRERLERRASRQGDPFDMSDARSPAVYGLVQSQFEPITRSHLAVDTSEDIDRVLQRVEAEIARL
jgi:predicted kinase